MFTLIIEDKDGSIADEYSFEEGEFIIGRSHSSDIILPADNVSRRHARLYTQGGKCFLEDLGSSNGVHVNGKRVHGVSELARSAQIKIGDYFLHVEGAQSGQVTGQSPAVETSLPVEPSSVAVQHVENPVSELARPGSFGRLVGTNLATQGRPFEIVSAVNLIGRGKDCTITILDPSVSRIHGKILVTEDGEFCVEDLKSSNGVYINDDRVDMGSFSHGDRVRFGNVEFICERMGQGEDSDAMIEAFKGSRLQTWWIAGGIAIVVIIAAVVGYLLWGGDSKKEKKRQDKQSEASATVKGGDRAALADEIDGLLETARKAASKDEWRTADKALQTAEKRLRKGREIDNGGKIRRRFRRGQKALRQERERYNAMVSALEEERYSAAQQEYKRIQSLEKGFMKGLAKRRLVDVKNKLVSAAEERCDAGDLQGCLQLYKKAQGLDNSLEKPDAKIGERIVEIRYKISGGQGEKE
jgi:pSer/pThr/pTyr-binding forkhead associated (FHA) protein